MVSIITVNFNQTELTCALLESIRLQDYHDVQVIVVDNGSRENPAGIFHTRYPQVKFLRSEKNLGFAGGNNLALPYATGEYLFFVNNDTEIPDGCIARLLEFLESTPEAGIVSPLICYARRTAYGGRLTADGFEEPDFAEGFYEKTNITTHTTTVHRPPSTVGRPPSTVIQYAGMPRVNPFTARSRMAGNGLENEGQYTLPFKTGYAHGAAMMLPRKVLNQVGPMQEDYFLYYEEVDWCERIRAAGYSVWVEPRASIWHKESMTMKTLGTAKIFYLSRNRVLFMRRHYRRTFGIFILFLIFITIPKQVIGYLSKGEWQEMRAFLAGTKAGVFNDTSTTPYAAKA